MSGSSYLLGGAPVSSASAAAPNRQVSTVHLRIRSIVVVVVVVHAFGLADASHNVHYLPTKPHFIIQKKPSLKVDFNNHIRGKQKLFKTCPKGFGQKVANSRLKTLFKTAFHHSKKKLL